jgi:hypothetical protein
MLGEPDVTVDEPDVTVGGRAAFPDVFELVVRPLKPDSGLAGRGSRA